MDKFSARMLLPDRIQLTFIPDVINTFPQKHDYEGPELDYKRDETAWMIAVNESFKDVDAVKDNPIKNEYYNKRWYTAFEQAFLPADAERIIKHPRMRSNIPYSITLEFNFIEYLLSLVYDLPSFNGEYHESIRVHNTNYITSQCWEFQNKTVGEIYESSTDYLKDIVYGLWNDFFQGTSLLINKVTVHHIEYNTDIYVGHNQSLSVMQGLVDFMFTDVGRSYQKELGVWFTKVVKGFESNAIGTNPTLIDDVGSIRFYIASGCWVKYYRKTKDHIRFEVGFEKDFIKKKCKTLRGNPTNNYLTHFRYLRKLAKDVYKKAKPIAIIEKSLRSDGSMSRYKRLADFITSIDPYLAGLAQFYLAGKPIDQQDLIDYIKRNKNVASVYSSDVVRVSSNLYGMVHKRVYRYDPFRKIRKKPVSTTKMKDYPIPLKKEYADFFNLNRGGEHLTVNADAKKNRIKALNSAIDGLRDQVAIIEKSEEW